MVDQADRRDYSIAASHSTQDTFARVATRLEALIDQRDRDVAAALADFAAEGVSEEYHGAERRWRSAAAEVRAIIDALRSALERNDETARTALQRARAAVESIG